MRAVLKRAAGGTEGQYSRFWMAVLKRATGGTEKDDYSYVDEDTMDVNELIDFWDRSRDPADQWIVITDVYGGSVNNAFMERLGDDSLRLIAGMSLPLVLEVFSKLSTLDDAELAALVSSVRQKGTCLCSLPNSVEEDEDF